MASIILMGIKHCGKSTQANLIAKKLNLPSYDTDTVMEKLSGKKPRELYVQDGPEAFMEWETKACMSIQAELAEKGTDAVIATGGGICCNEQAVSVLKTMGRLVFLVASEKTAADRIVREASVGPDGKLKGIPAYIARKNPETLDDVRKIFHEFYLERTDMYSHICDVAVRMENLPKMQNTMRILKSMGVKIV